VLVRADQIEGRQIIQVQDTGVGIASAALPRLFEKFFRVGEGKGAGLGLAIAGWIVREHGGSVIAANNDSGGATFSVEFPAAPRPDEPTLALSAHPQDRGDHEPTVAEQRRS